MTTTTSTQLVGLTRGDLEMFARAIWTEAYAADPIRTLDVTVAVTGSEVFVWGNLSVRQLHAFGRCLLFTARS